MNAINLGISSITLIIFNTVPLIGVLFFDWDIATLMFLYWSESGIIGFLNIFKILQAKGTDQLTEKIQKQLDNAKINVLLAPFFLFHFGSFMLVHGIFVFTTFGFPKSSLLGIIIAIISMFISHGLSYITNFLGKKEYCKIGPGQQMQRPYQRIIILHVTIIIGGILAQYYDTPLWSLVIMVLLKIGVDLVSHVRVHIPYVKEKLSS